ncbi:uncharacterized protein LOC142541852 [Primulina tabacum]|uniref:uncharacterized protein LOC142541852 n=1 Tax=Primulina tabacum TaxID=48773 RepID=UPI003F5A6A86
MELRLLLEISEGHARELASALPGKFPKSILPCATSVHVRENKANKAEELLGLSASTFPDKSNIILLVPAQIAAAAGHPQIAADSLVLKIPDIQHNELEISMVLMLCLMLQFGGGHAMTEDNKLDIIMEEAASFKLRHGKKDEAARLYKELAEAYEKLLKTVYNLTGIDVESLEKTSGAKHVESNGLTLGIAEAYKSKKEKPKKKRKRKPKYPKGFDPAKLGPPPDPERWLPKRERSSYRPKWKEKRAAKIRGSLGAHVIDKES